MYHYGRKRDTSDLCFILYACLSSNDIVSLCDLCKKLFQELHVFFCVPSRNVTPDTQVDFKVWSHHTLKADALLGKATLDLIQALEQHDGKCMNKLHQT